MKKIRKKGRLHGCVLGLQSSPKRVQQGQWRVLEAKSVITDWEQPRGKEDFLCLSPGRFRV